MIIESDKCVFDVGAECIVNTVNCVGVMGKGLALEFSLRYPKLEEQYIEDCKNHLVEVGKLNMYEIDDMKIINFPTKWHFKYPSKKEWIISGLNYFRAHYKEYNIKSIAFPLLGASLGGLDKDEVTNLMYKYLSGLDIEIIICKSKEISKDEKEMINSFKDIDPNTYVEKLKLRKPQVESISLYKNKINRFYDILNFPGVSIGTYKKLYSYFKNKEYEENISLFSFN